MDQYYTAKQVAETIRLHPQTIYLKARTGELESVRAGNKLLFTWAMIQRFLNRTKA